MKKICFCMAMSMSLRAFMVDHIKALAEKYDITVFANFAGDDCRDLFDSSVTLVHIPFKRKICIWADCYCLWQLYRKLHTGQFDSIHSIMPKTGLLAMTAGWLARIPVRIHMFTGQVWVTQKGLWRYLLKSIDRVISGLATTIYADSISQRDFLVEQKVIRTGRVLGDGSVNGVDCGRFKPTLEAREKICEKYAIPKEAIIFGFMGRLNHDKGIGDLIEAFIHSDVKKTSHLLLVGPDEEGIEDELRSQYPNTFENIHFTGSTRQPEAFYPAFDVFCIPSYREGFGSSVIEAAACGVPALASRIYGLTDAVVEGQTGLMHEPRNIKEITSGLERYANNSILRKSLGQKARSRVLKKFTRQRLTQAMQEEYKELLEHSRAANE